MLGTLSLLGTLLPRPSGYPDWKLTDMGLVDVMAGKLLELE